LWEDREFSEPRINQEVKDTANVQSAKTMLNDLEAKQPSKDTTPAARQLLP